MRSWVSKHLQRRLSVDRDELRAYAGLSSFTFIERVGNALLLNTDVFLGAKLISTETAGTYSLTGRAFEPVRMASDRFAPAFLPGLAHLAGEGNHQRVDEVSNRLLNFVGYIISIGVACVTAL